MHFPFILVLVLVLVLDFPAFPFEREDQNEDEDDSEKLSNMPVIIAQVLLLGAPLARIRIQEKPLLEGLGPCYE